MRKLSTAMVAAAALTAAAATVAASGPAARAEAGPPAGPAAGRAVAVLAGSATPFAAPGVLTPSSDPYATAVGGTTLGIGRKDPRLFETGWSTSLSFDLGDRWVSQGEAYASGGGDSLLWAQPAYQRGVVPNSLARAPGNRPGLVRALPDISADADPSTGMAVGLLTFNGKGAVTGYVEQPIGGTSLASPLVAGMVADALPV